MTKTAPSLVTMYSRTTCGLCDEARAVIQEALFRIPFEFEEIFVDDNEELERRYGLRVPVVLVDGVEHFETEVEPAAFVETLRN